MNDPDRTSTDKGNGWQVALLLRGETAKDQYNLRVFSIWCYVYGACISAVILTAHFFPEMSGRFAGLLAALPVLPATVGLLAFLRFLREADEFVRKVQLEGMAVGFGAGSIFCIGYYALELFGAPRLPIVVATLPMVLGWIVGVLLVAYQHR